MTHDELIATAAKICHTTVDEWVRRVCKMIALETIKEHEEYERDVASKKRHANDAEQRSES